MGPPIRPATPAPAEIAELASSCAEFVRRAVGANLDLTPDTLPILDEYVRKVRGEKREEILRLLAPAVGAYFGEVLRRTFDCRWHAAGSDYPSYRLEFRECFLYFNPIGMAVEAILLEDTAGLGAAIVTSEEAMEQLADQLAETGPVRLEDYYSLTTRFEVIDQIVHHLMVRREPDENEYTAEFYQELAGRVAAN